MRVLVRPHSVSEEHWEHALEFGFGQGTTESISRALQAAFLIGMSRERNRLLEIVFEISEAALDAGVSHEVVMMCDEIKSKI